MDIFYAISEPTRRDIIEMLATGIQLSASQIYEKFNVSPSAISQHLKVLKETNVVVMQKKAQQRIYQLNPIAFVELEDWTSNLTKVLDNRFEAMDKLIELEKIKKV